MKKYIFISTLLLGFLFLTIHGAQAHVLPDQQTGVFDDWHFLKRIFELIFQYNK